jgi:hypothetical protein
VSDAIAGLAKIVRFAADESFACLDSFDCGQVNERFNISRFD